jgi:hypothetical protein
VIGGERCKGVEQGPGIERLQRHGVLTRTAVLANNDFGDVGRAAFQTRGEVTQRPGALRFRHGGGPGQGGLCRIEGRFDFRLAGKTDLMHDLAVDRRPDDALLASGRQPAPGN